MSRQQIADCRKRRRLCAGRADPPHANAELPGLVGKVRRKRSWSGGRQDLGLDAALGGDKVAIPAHHFASLRPPPVRIPSQGERTRAKKFGRVHSPTH